jgi:hypothetical protein
VRPYIDEVEHISSGIRVPDQILNMDEIEFCSRPMEVKKKTIVYSIRCGSKAAYREETYLNHLSLLVTINLVGQRVTLLSLVRNKVAIKDLDLQLMPGNVGLC